MPFRSILGAYPLELIKLDLPLTYLHKYNGQIK